MERKLEKYTIEVSEDDLLALHGVLNMLEAMDELFGESSDRVEVRYRLVGLRNRYRQAREAAGYMQPVAAGGDRGDDDA